VVVVKAPAIGRIVDLPLQHDGHDHKRPQEEEILVFLGAPFLGLVRPSVRFEDRGSRIRKRSSA
jgi:hypothetical protein